MGNVGEFDFSHLLFANDTLIIYAANPDHIRHPCCLFLCIEATLDKLMKRNVIVVDRCCMCKKGGEFIDHLLHCEVARELWSSHFHLFCADWVMPRRVRELLMGWKGRVGSHNILEVWRLTPLYLMWCIWRKWNARNFEDRETPAVELKNNMFKSLYT